MAADYKTPDFYVSRISTFPPSVAEVGTAIPAFIGYTQKAKKVADNDLILKPTVISSLNEYESYYGYPREDDIAVTVTGDRKRGFTGIFTDPGVTYLMHYSLKMFFDNGGKKCYIISVGTYQSTPVITLSPGNEAYGLKDGLDTLAKEDEPTLIVIPEAIKLSSTDYATLVQAVLLQCNTLGDRFAIFDIYDGASSLDAAGLATNRDHFSNNYLKYGAAYYPFIKTSLNFFVNESETNVKVTYGTNPVRNLIDLKTTKPLNTAVYDFVKNKLRERYVPMPPSPAVAGVYATVDTIRGVWKAPANISLADVIEPLVKINNFRQGDLNVDAATGKSINAIRTFAGKGTLVWGARTLAGNDNEWRYIQVRRFFNMVEESVKKSIYWAVFEPNDANTWGKVRGMVENYLIQKWREGALAGATPDDAFFVNCGMGTTMTFQDTLEGRMNVEIGMAVIRPGEFIILKFSQKMQTS